MANDSLSYIIARELLLHDDGIAGKLIASNKERFYNFKPGFCVAYVKSAWKSAMDMNSNASNFRRFVPYSYTVEKDDGFLAFIYSVDKHLNSIDSLVQQIRVFCERQTSYCCISSKFSELNNRNAYVNQVETLLPICMRDNEQRVFLADEYYCEYMCSFTGNKLEPAIIDLTAILYLLEYDKKHGTNYLHTLDCYVNSGNNSTQAAKELFIDRSTLSYRLKKIVNIMPINIDDSDIAFNLKLGLIVLKTLHPKIEIPE